MSERKAAIRQPKPTRERPGVEVLPEVIKDLEARIQVGIKKYGEPLTTHNGRDALLDAYQEVLDLAVYMKQEILERGLERGFGPEASKKWREIHGMDAGMHSHGDHGNEGQAQGPAATKDGQGNPAPTDNTWAVPGILVIAVLIIFGILALVEYVF
ncbi:hypothetical protein [Desulfatibacillum aliphaticivorans]|uniref:hypothetical protein n=1 Tax=Desulfatibacillum aliphaticivorans TaxID=218208 RepID=UPI000420FD23|nr:hypothetical protein [Desulfatibacillum aliphaticivorans]